MYKTSRILASPVRKSRRIINIAKNIRNLTTNTKMKRLTIPPNFHRRQSTSTLERQDSKKITKLSPEEVAYGLYYQNNKIQSSRAVRRSARLSKQKRDLWKHCPTADLFKPQSDIVVNRSKSLFKEINELCAVNSNVRGSKPTGGSSLSPTTSSPQRSLVNLHISDKSDFCAKLSEQIINKFKRDEPPLFRKIMEEIHHTNRILRGPDLGVEDKENPQPTCHNNENEIGSEFIFFGPNEWIFNTPPNQKITKARLQDPEDASIKPAIIYTTRKEKTVFEINDEAFNLSKCRAGQSLNLDKKFFNFEGPSAEIKRPSVSSEDKENFCPFSSNAGYTPLIPTRPLKRTRIDEIANCTFFNTLNTPLRCFQHSPSRPSCSKYSHQNDVTFNVEIEANHEFKLLLKNQNLVKTTNPKTSRKKHLFVESNDTDVSDNINNKLFNFETDDDFKMFDFCQNDK